MGPATTYFMLLHIWSSISYWEKSIARQDRHLKCIRIFYVYESPAEQQTCFVRDLKRKVRSLIISVQFPNSKQRPCGLWNQSLLFQFRSYRCVRQNLAKHCKQSRVYCKAQYRPELCFLCTHKTSGGWDLDQRQRPHTAQGAMRCGSLDYWTRTSMCAWLG